LINSIVVYLSRDMYFSYIHDKNKLTNTIVPVWSQDLNFLQNISWYFLCSIVVVRFVDICETDDFII